MGPAFGRPNCPSSFRPNVQTYQYQTTPVCATTHRTAMALTPGFEPLHEFGLGLCLAVAMAETSRQAITP